MELKKNLEINMLFNLYGKLLNAKQQQMMKHYYFYDNSLSEMAQEFGVTRQAVSDLLNRVVATLYDYESKLKLLEKYNKSNHILTELLKQETNAKTAKELQKLKQILEA